MSTRGAKKRRSEASTTAASMAGPDDEQAMYEMIFQRASNVLADLEQDLPDEVKLLKKQLKITM